MTVKSIVKMGNPALRQIAEPVDDPSSDEIRSLVENMKESLAAVGGVGLAAPQIGVPLSVVIYEVPAARIQSEDSEGSEGSEESEDGGDMNSIPLTVLINPVITPLSDEKVLGWEGCLSVPGLRGLVPRYTHIEYTGLNIQGDTVNGEARDFHARVIQHECDHLEGILYPERMTDLSYLVYESEMQAFMESF